MAVPKKRTTKSRRNKRRMHIYLESPSTAVCSKCKKPKRPHTVCLHCGYYKGEEVINVLGKLTKKERKKKEKEMKKKTKEEQPDKKDLTWTEMSKK